MKRFKRLSALLFSLIFALTTVAPALTIASAVEGETVTTVLLDLDFDSIDDMNNILGQDQAKEQNTLSLNTTDGGTTYLRYYQDGSDYMLRFPFKNGKMDIESEARYEVEIRLQNPTDNLRLFGYSDGNPSIDDTDRGDIYAQFADLSFMGVCTHEYTYGTSDPADYGYAETSLALSHTTPGIGSANPNEWRTIKLIYDNKQVKMELIDEKKNGDRVYNEISLPLSRISGDKEFFHKAGRTYDHLILWNEPQFRTMWVDYIKVTEIAPVVDPEAPIKLINYDFDIAKPKLLDYTGTMARAVDYIDRWGTEIVSGKMEDINGGRSYEGKLFFEPLGDPNSTMYLGYKLPKKLYKENKQLINISFDFEHAIGQDRGTGLGMTYAFMGDQDDARTPYEDTNLKDFGLLNNGGFTDSSNTFYYPMILDHSFEEDDYVIGLNEKHHVNLSLNTQDNTYTATISSTEFGEEASYTGTIPTGDFGWKDGVVLDKFKIAGDEDIVLDNLLITVKYLEPPVLGEDDENEIDGEIVLGEEEELYYEPFNSIPTEFKYVAGSDTAIYPDIYKADRITPKAGETASYFGMGSTGSALIVPLKETIKFDGKNEYTVNFKYNNDSWNQVAMAFAANNTANASYKVFNQGFILLRCNKAVSWPDFPNYKQWLGIAEAESEHPKYSFSKEVLNNVELDYTIKINTLTFDVTATLKELEAATGTWKLVETATWNIKEKTGNGAYDAGEEYPYLAYISMDSRKGGAWFDDVRVTKRSITVVPEGEEDPDAQKFTYTFYDEDGETVLKTKTVAEGTQIVPPSDPTKDSTAQYSYMFSGWEGYTDGMEITEDVSFRATYVESVNKYVYKFVDGTNEIKSETVDYGTVIVAPNENPSKAADAQYTYTFAGWTGFTEGMTITEDVTFEADYDTVTNRYSYVFYDEDRETVLGEGELDYGTVIPKPANPTKAPSAQNTYQFTGWTGYTDGQVITEDVIFIAQYRAVPIDQGGDDDDDDDITGNDVVLLDIQFNSTDDASKYSFKSATDGVSDRAEGHTSSANINAAEGYLDIYNDAGMYMVYMPMSEAMAIDGNDTYTIKTRLQMPFTNNRIMGLVNSNYIGSNTNPSPYGRFAESFLAIQGSSAGTFAIPFEGTGLAAGGNEKWTDVEIVYTKNDVKMTVSYDNNGQLVTNTDTVALSALSTSAAFKHTPGRTYDNIVFSLYGDSSPERWGRIKVDYITVTKTPGQSSGDNNDNVSEEINLPETDGTYIAKLEFNNVADSQKYSYRVGTAADQEAVNGADDFLAMNPTEGTLHYRRGSGDNFISIPLDEAINLDGTDKYQVMMRAKMPLGTSRFLGLVNSTADITAANTYGKFAAGFLALQNLQTGLSVDGENAASIGGQEVWTDIVLTFANGNVKIDTSYIQEGQPVTDTKTVLLATLTANANFKHKVGTSYDKLMIANIVDDFASIYFDYIAVVKNPTIEGGNDPVLPKYTYTFYDEDGTTVLKTATVNEGTEIIPPSTPSKPATSEFRYEFEGWTGFTQGMTISTDVSFTATFRAIAQTPSDPSDPENNTGLEEYEEVISIKNFNFDGTDNQADIIGLKGGISQVNTAASQLEISRDWEEDVVYLKLPERVDMTSDEYSYVLEFKVKTPTINGNSRLIGLVNGTEYNGVYEAMSENIILANNSFGDTDNEKRIQMSHKSTPIGNASADEWKVIRYTLSKHSYRMEVVVYNADGSIKSQEESRGSLDSISGANKVGYHVLGKTYDHVAFGHINDSETTQKIVVDYVKFSKMPIVNQAPEVDDEVIRPLEPSDPQNPGMLLNVNFDDKPGNFVDFSNPAVDKKLKEHNDGSKYLQIDYYKKGDSFGGWYFTDTMPDGDKSDYEVSFDFMLHRGKHDNYTQFGESFIAINDSMQCDGEQTYHQFRLLGAKNYGNTAKFVVATQEITGDNSDIIEDSWYSYKMTFNRGSGAYTVEITNKGTGNVLKYSGQTNGESWGGMIGSKEYDSLKYYRNGSISLDNIRIEKKPNIPVLSRNGVSFLRNRVVMEEPSTNVNILVDTISLDFREKMDMSTFANGNITLKANGQDVSFTYEAKQSEVHLKDFMLMPNTEYTIFVSENVKSAFGSNIANDFEYKFTTGDPKFEATLTKIVSGVTKIESFVNLRRTVKAVIDVKNITNNNETAVLVVVYRDANGGIQRAESYDVSMSAMTMEEQQIQVTISKPTGCANVEFMLWDSLDSVKAISKSLNFNKN